MKGHAEVDLERRDRNERAMREAGVDALVCALPSHVLLLSGYWPVVGTAVAVATPHDTVGLVLPADERNLAELGWAEVCEGFEPGTLDGFPSLLELLAPPLRRLLHRLGIDRGRIGYEHGPLVEPSSYAATNRYLGAMPALLAELLPHAWLVPADDLLARSRAVLTPRELERVRIGCRLVGEAFETGARAIVPGATEREVAAAFRGLLEANADREGAMLSRAGGFVWCMSGPDAALAYRAFARTRRRQIEFGELVMLHCNSFVDGLWTDVTRTYGAGGADERIHELFDAVLQARDAAIRAVAPGVRASDVDRAARETLTARGLGGAFLHGTGHGVGYAAIDHRARPRIHPSSDDVLEPGMVFNVEPAVYFEGWGGLRHCDMVAVTREGAEILTGFQSSMDVLHPRLWLSR